MRKLVLLFVLFGWAVSVKAQCSNTAYGAYTCNSTAFAFTSSVTARDFTASVTAGQTMLLASYTDSASGSLTASAGGACNLISSYGGGVTLSGAVGIVASAFATKTGTCSIRVTDTVSATIAGLTVLWSGAPSQDVSGNLVSLGSITSGTTANCPAVTTVNNGDLVICATIDGGRNSSGWTAGTGFTVINSATNTTPSTEAMVQTTAGAITPQFKYGSTATIAAATITLSTAAASAQLKNLNGIPVSNTPVTGNIKLWNGTYIDPYTGYVGTLGTLKSPFTAPAALTLLDFTNTTSGNAPTVATLTGGTHGVLFSFGVASVGAGLTYTNTVTAGNLPQPVALGSVVYNASGANGLLCTTSNSSQASVFCGSAQQSIATLSITSASAGYWLKANCPAFGGTGATDCGALGGLAGGSDYVIPHLNAAGGNCPWNGWHLEAFGGSSADCLPYTNNTLYRINVQENDGEAAFTATFTNGSAAISATQTLAVNQAVSFTTTGTLPTNFNTEIFTGTYTSGATASGTVGQTCNLAVTNGGGSSATATVMLNNSGVLTGGEGLTWTNRGSGYTSAPTAAAVSNGTATCSGTAVISTVLATPILFVSSTGLSGSGFQVSAIQGGPSIVAGSAGSGTHTVTVYDLMTLCSGNPPVYVGSLFAPAYTTPSAVSALNMGVAGEGSQVAGQSYFFGGYVFDANGDFSLTSCLL